MMRYCRSMAIMALVIASACNCWGRDAQEPRSHPLPEVHAEDAPIALIQRECLPILNGIVDSLWTVRSKFPELAHLKRRPIKKPFDQFLYQFRVKAVPGQKAMRIEPGGCSITLFFEPFSRTRVNDSGLYTTTARTAKGFPCTEFDNLATRFNYELQLGTPNKELEKAFASLVKKATTELAKKDVAFRTRKKTTSQAQERLLPADVLHGLLKDYPKSPVPFDKINEQLRRYGAWHCQAGPHSHGRGCNHYSLIIYNTGQLADWVITIKWRAFPDGNTDPITICYGKAEKRPNKNMNTDGHKPGARDAQDTKPLPATLDELKRTLSEQTGGRWSVHGSWLAGQWQDSRGKWRLRYSIIPNPKTSEAGRATAEEFCTVRCFVQMVLASSDRHILIVTTSAGPEIGKILAVCDLQPLGRPPSPEMLRKLPSAFREAMPPLLPYKPLKRFVVEDCGLVWNGMKLERRVGTSDQPNPSGDADKPRR